MNQKEGGRVGSGTKVRVTRSGDGGGSYRLLKGCAMEHVVCRLYREGGKGGCVCVWVRGGWRQWCDGGRCDYDIDKRGRMATRTVGELSGSSSGSHRQDSSPCWNGTRLEEKEDEEDEEEKRRIIEVTTGCYLIAHAFEQQQQQPPGHKQCPPPPGHTHPP